MSRQRTLTSSGHLPTRSRIAGRPSSMRASTRHRIPTRCASFAGESRSAEASRYAVAILMPMKRFALLVAFALIAGHLLTAQSSRLLVLNKEDATLVIVDPASGKIQGTVPVGQGPHEL